VESSIMTQVRNIGSNKWTLLTRLLYLWDWMSLIQRGWWSFHLFLTQYITMFSNAIRRLIAIDRLFNWLLNLSTFLRIWCTNPPQAFTSTTNPATTLTPTDRCTTTGTLAPITPTTTKLKVTKFIRRSNWTAKRKERKGPTTKIKNLKVRLFISFT
jgi:hypothetical protein